MVWATNVSEYRTFTLRVLRFTKDEGNWENREEMVEFEPTTSWPWGVYCATALSSTLQHLEASAVPDIQSRRSTSDLLAMLVRCCIGIHGIYGSGHPRTSHLEYPSVTSTCDRIVEKRRILWNFNFLFCSRLGQKIAKIINICYLDCHRHCFYSIWLQI